MDETQTLDAIRVNLEVIYACLDEASIVKDRLWVKR
jgi:hypothetical protein